MKKFIEIIKEKRKKNKFFAVKELRKNSGIAHSLINELNNNFNSKFKKIKYNINIEDFSLAKVHLANIATDISKIYDILDIMQKQHIHKPSIDITNELESKLYNTWGIRDLGSGDEEEAVWEAKNLCQDISGLQIVGLFYKFCEDNP